MIAIKALKPTQDQTGSVEQTYKATQAEPAPSRWPVALAAIVLAVAGYLRSLTTAEAVPQAPGAEQPEEEAAAPPSRDARLEESEPGPDVADETGSLPDKNAKPDPAQDANLGSGAAGGPVPGLTDFLGIDSPPIDYEQLPLQPFVPATIEFGLGRVSNDNGFPLTVIGGGSLGLSPSGGGGFEPIGVSGSSPVVVVGRFNPIVITPQPALDQGGGDEDPGDNPVLPPSPGQRNRPPRLSGSVQLGDIGICQAAFIALAGLLAGATDADADTLGIRDLQVSSGTITLTEGGWQYRPMAGYYGPVTLSYGVTDGIDTVTQTATLTVVEVVEQDGTPGDDVLTGTDCADLIRACEGRDIVDARGGNDIVHGGAGNDIIFAGSGNDTVYGGSGNDVIYGGTGNDSLFGEDGDDRLFGEAGDDLLVGGAGNDFLDGGDGNDTLLGGAGDDTLLGRDGDDTLSSGDGDDKIDGGTGDDIIDAGTGADEVAGGDGHDTIQAGDGNDKVEAGQGDDIVLAGAGDDDVKGEDGEDILDGGEGNDCLVGGAGDDTLLGGKGDDNLKGGSGADTLDGGKGRDTVEAGSGNDTVVASLDGDDDCLDGEEGRDTLDLSQTSKGVTVDLTKNKAVGIEIGCDTVFDFEVLIGGKGDDHLIVGDKPVAMTGGKGDDIFEFVAPDEEDRDLIHQILDLQEGDRIVVKQYRLRSEDDDGDDNDDGDDDGDRFDEVYNQSSEDERPFRFRIEKVGDEDRTYVDVFMNDPDDKDYSIEIYGNHKLYYC